MPCRHRRALLLALLALAAPDLGAVTVQLHALVNADQTLLGLQAEADSTVPSVRGISDDGRHVLFASSATNLTADPKTDLIKVFLRDRTLGSTVDVGKRSDGTPAQANAGDMALSRDGRYVVFTSADPLLTATPASAAFNVYLRDRVAGSTELVSIAVGGGGANADCAVPGVSDDGRFVIWASAASNLIVGDGNNRSDVFVRDRQSGTTVRTSVADAGAAEANGDSTGPRLSGDGRYAVFVSAATNLVPANGSGTQVFVRDLVGNHTVLASAGGVGVPGDAAATAAAISGDGRFVAFESAATNLVAGDGNGAIDVFVKDTSTGSIERISRSTADAEGNADSTSPSISADGRRVMFTSLADQLVAGDGNGVSDVFLRDRQAGTTVRLSVDDAGIEGLAASSSGALSAPGGSAVFQSDATNLVVGDSNGVTDVFVRDLGAGQTRRISVADAAGPFPAIPDRASAGVDLATAATRVAFGSRASNLVTDDANAAADAFVRDLPGGANALISRTAGGAVGNADSSSPVLSADGRYAVFASSASNLVAGDGNGASDVFLVDRQTGQISRVSRSVGGGDANGASDSPTISRDGSTIAFASTASNLTAPVPGNSGNRGNIFVVDRASGSALQASVSPSGQSANQDCVTPSLSADGRQVAFQSRATNLVAGDASNRNKIFRRSLGNGATVLVSVGLAGAAADGHSTATRHALSADGRLVSFASNASNLVANDLNAVSDVFVRDVVLQTTERVSLAADGSPLEADAVGGEISDDGRFVAFATPSNLLSGDPANLFEFGYLRDRIAGTTRTVTRDAAGALPQSDIADLTVSADGRNVGFVAAASNWQADSGVVAPKAIAYLVRLVEATSLAFAAGTPGTFYVGVPQRVEVDLAGSETDPRGGSIVIGAGGGVSCSSGSFTATSATTTRAGCVLTFVTPGPRSLTASYSGNANYAASDAPLRSIDVVQIGLFADGFE